MALTALHAQLAGIVPGVLSRRLDGDLAEADAHAANGCSQCARALVNARDAAVALAEAAAEPAPQPRPALRERILGRARVGALPARRGTHPRRFFDPAGEIARLHVGAYGDAERTSEVDALGAAVFAEVEDDACERLLAEVQALVGFPLLFVSIVRGERVGCRAQRGLPPGMSRDRRRETTFCTHTVSTDAPLVVPDAAAEPFFRGSAMVVRDGVRAYVGVPLRTSRGVVIGTVCAMGFAPRAVGPEVVRAMERCAERVAVEIERGRRPPPGADYFQ
jgi:GAF domain